MTVRRNTNDPRNKMSEKTAKTKERFQKFRSALSLKSLRAKLPSWMGPSQTLAVAVLVVISVLLGRDVLSSIQVRVEIRDLRREKQQLERTIAADSTLLRQLEDPAFLERYARENYLMRREGDDMYVFD